MPLQIHYPFKPFQVTQTWGTPNASYAQQFDDPDFQLHNGIDARTGYYTWQWKDGKLQKIIATEYPVYCPVEGFVVEAVEFQPNGGGHQMSLVSKKKVMVGNKECYARIYLCHAKKILVRPGYEPSIGSLLMIADNTGFSTGLHTHFGLYRLDDKRRKLDTNKATGSYDPALCFTDKYAIDEASAMTLAAASARYYTYVLTGA